MVLDSTRTCRIDAFGKIGEEKKRTQEKERNHDRPGDRTQHLVRVKDTSYQLDQPVNC